MSNESPSNLESRIEALNIRIKEARDPALIRAFTNDLITLESQLQKSKRKSKTP